MARRAWWAVACILAIVGMACAGPSATCTDVDLTPEAAAMLSTESGLGEFAPLRPCASGRGFVVTSVVADVLPGSSPNRRLSFIVERNRERVYVLSETRATITSLQIPQGTDRFVVSAGSSSAEGFIGASGSGGEMAYLRWRAGGVTYELDATLGRALDEAEVRQIAQALLRRSEGG